MPQQQLQLLPFAIKHFWCLFSFFSFILSKNIGNNTNPFVRHILDHQQQNRTKQNSDCDNTNITIILSTANRGVIQTEKKPIISLSVDNRLKFVGQLTCFHCEFLLNDDETSVKKLSKSSISQSTYWPASVYINRLFFLAYGMLHILGVEIGFHQ